MIAILLGSIDHPDDDPSQGSCNAVAVPRGAVAGRIWISVVNLPLMVI